MTERRMTLAEFLQRDNGSGTAYELIAGIPTAIRPRSRRGGAILRRLRDTVIPALRWGQFAVVSAAIAPPERDDACYVADLAVGCGLPIGPRQLLRDPILIVEIQTAQTEWRDRKAKLPSYLRIPGLSEILILDSEHYYAEVLRRDGDHWFSDLAQGPNASLRLAAVGIEIAMAELYRGIDIGDDAAA
jgi:Uma2 family endonuclease